MAQASNGSGVVKPPKTPTGTGLGGVKKPPKEIEDYVTLPEKRTR